MRRVSGGAGGQKAARWHRRVWRRGTEIGGWRRAVCTLDDARGAAHRARRQSHYGAAAAAVEAATAVEATWSCVLCRPLVQNTGTLRESPIVWLNIEESPSMFNLTTGVHGTPHRPSFLKGVLNNARAPVFFSDNRLFSAIRGDYPERQNNNSAISLL